MEVFIDGVRYVPAGEQPDLMTINEVSNMLGVPAATLRYWRHQGHGPKGFRVGRHLRFKREDVLEWAKAQEEES